MLPKFALTLTRYYRDAPNVTSLHLGENGQGWQSRSAAIKAKNAFDAKEYTPDTNAGEHHRPLVFTHKIGCGNLLGKIANTNTNTNTNTHQHHA